MFLRTGSSAWERCAAIFKSRFLHNDSPTTQMTLTHGRYTFSPTYFMGHVHQ